jgi:hypothetical protein
MKEINGENGFLMLFSDSEFKGADIMLEWSRFECNGDIYRLKGLGAVDSFPPMEGWLCPALRKYYKDAPNKLYVQAKGIFDGMAGDVKGLKVLMDRYLQGIDLLDRIDELTKEVTPDQKNGWRPLLLACKDEIQRSKRFP